MTVDFGLRIWDLRCEICDVGYGLRFTVYDFYDFHDLTFAEPLTAHCLRLTKISDPK